MVDSAFLRCVQSGWSLVVVVLFFFSSAPFYKIDYIGITPFMLPISMKLVQCSLILLLKNYTIEAKRNGHLLYCIISVFGSLWKTLPVRSSLRNGELTMHCTQHLMGPMMIGMNFMRLSSSDMSLIFSIGSLRFLVLCSALHFCSCNF